MGDFGLHEMLFGNKYSLVNISFFRENSFWHMNIQEYKWWIDNFLQFDHFKLLLGGWKSGVSLSPKFIAYLKVYAF